MTHHTLRLAALACGLVTGLIPSAAPLGAQGAVELPAHELIFSRQASPDRTNYDVWRICGDGSQLASLLVMPGDQYQLAVAPDGRSFVYASAVDGQMDIFRKSFGRGEPQNLTNHSANDGSPFFSPDGTRMGFFSNRDGGKAELYVLTLSDSSLRRLTTDTLHDGEGSWSPDGRHIRFTRFFPGAPDNSRPAAGEIMELEVATGALRQLTALGNGYNGGLSHSPDGRRLAFHRSSATGAEIWTMNADGSEARAITRTKVDEYGPEWSPDGNWLAVTAGTGDLGGGRFDLWLLRPDGSERRLLAATENGESWHRWRTGEFTCR
ncbi:MAG: PD40 domain-containing protein [Gemmatimonadales bacterium]|nr:PD40 domain-containing protein [Gemmatimonadota bacterium]MCL4215307.1 PD40 domain-containing protein [Gemmatimonadales bacterium]